MDVGNGASNGNSGGGSEKALYTPPGAVSPIISGGYGFTYADRVGARVLLAMLAGEPLLGEGAGHPADVRFEQRGPDSELYDDLVVRSENGARWAVTIKSGDPVRDDAIDADLVERAWYMLANPPVSALPVAESHRDLLIIAQPPPSSEIATTFRELVDGAISQDPEQSKFFATAPNVGNAKKRAMLESLKGADETREPQVLLLRLRLLALDLDPGTASDLGGVRALCEAAIEEPERWEELWNSLVRIAGDARGKGAWYTTDRLVQALPTSLMLRLYGDAEEDYRALQRWGQSRMPRNRLIGGRLPLDNTSTLNELDKAMSEAKTILLTGESGTGKSVVLAEWCEMTDSIYLRADLLKEPVLILAAAGVRRPLSAVLRNSRRREIHIVIDQIDRVVSDEVWGNLRLWIDALKGDERVTLVFGCANGVVSIRRAEINRLTGGVLLEITLKRDAEETLQQIAEAFPSTARVLVTFARSPLLTTPRALDQLVSLALPAWPSTYGDFLDLIWKHRIQGMTAENPFGDAAARVAAEALARDEAERGEGRLSTGIDPVVLERLQSRGVVVDDGESLTWDHDSTGDNIRTRILTDAGTGMDWSALVTGAIINPYWRRALRLHCLVVLEREGAAGFQKLLTAFRAIEDGEPLVQALFDAVVLCPPGSQIPVAIGSALIAERGLMARYIGRFLFSASSPVSVAAENDTLYVRAQIREPMWDRWSATVRLVLSQKEWFATKGVGLGLNVLAPVLQVMADQAPREIVRYALYLAHQIRKGKRSPGDPKEMTKNLAFQIGIYALAVEPESSQKFLRRCAGRTGPALDVLRYTPFGARVLPSLALPLGPKTRVDQEFATFYLTSTWYANVARWSSDLAIELLYAVLLREPNEIDVNPLDQGSLVGFTDRREGQFFPATPFHPALNAVFDRSFEEGLEVVATLVEVAVGEWIRNGGEPRSLDIVWDDEIRTFAGNRWVYQWLSGSSVSSYPLQSLLLTLERRLLETEDVDILRLRVGLVIARATNIALLAVLASVGKRHQWLMLGPLAPLLFDERILEFDRETSLKLDWQLLGGYSPGSKWWRDQKAHYEYANLPHRRIILDQFALNFLMSGENQGLAVRALDRWRAQSLTNPEEAQRLAVLIELYDRNNIRVERAGEGQVAFQIEMSADLAARTERERAEAIAHLRALTIGQESAKAIRSGEFGGIEELLADREYRTAGGTTDPFLLGESVAVELAAFLATRAGMTTATGDLVIHRAELLRRIIVAEMPDDLMPRRSDEAHWTTLIADHGASVFGVPPDSGEARKALLAFVRSAPGFALARLIEAVATIPGGAVFGLTVLRIARDYAVERVFRAQAARWVEYGIPIAYRFDARIRWALRHQNKAPARKILRRHRAKARPSACNVAFERSTRVYLSRGVWPRSDRPVLGGTDNLEAKRRNGAPSAYGEISLALAIFLRLHAGTPEEPAAQEILLDLLTAIGDTEERDTSYTGRSQVFEHFGAVLPVLSEGTTDLILALWARLVSGDIEDDDAEGLTIALLNAYASGLRELEIAALGFERMIAALDGNVPTSVTLRAFGIGRYGFNVEWTTEQGERWLQRNGTFYREGIGRLVRSRELGRLLKRTRGQEFRFLDSALFDAIVATPEAITRLKDEEISDLAERMIEFLRLLEAEPRRRDDWRRLLARLEATGTRIAWQILTEIVDRV